jgi:chorismate-pyruvate lyase
MSYNVFVRKVFLFVNNIISIVNQSLIAVSAETSSFLVRILLQIAKNPANAQK